MRTLCLLLLFVIGCPKKEDPVQPRYEIEEVDFPEDEDFDDLPESDTGLEEESESYQQISQNRLIDSSTLAPNKLV